ncbi:RNA recognition motif domain-containing protein [Hirschfeldia incana]|nr:RNA recognition motif domain-containing protein [Hirschfeldia incana]KAJ0236833.1 RNA recognition motif domain-containing protein [Hirschfeldia incana]KAJ0236834.1 RNA recognition motif domain-containing protein [Hirschfeldia incana]
MNIPNRTLSTSENWNASSDDASFFSSSLPLLPHQNLNLIKNHPPPLDEIASGLNHFNIGFDDHDSHPLETMLPGDEEQLLAGLMDDINLTSFSNTLDDLEECDLFGSGGGLELENDSLNKTFQNMSFADSKPENGLFKNGMGSVAGEHPYGEHPSRTLFVRNINSTVEDAELRAIFEQYGDIRTLYTACKHRGFVMVSYYDIRASRAAMRALQSKLLKGRKLDIHFSIPKDNPSEKDVNQGTLVVFNLAPSVSNRDLENIFGAYGEIKEIRETPNKRHHKFVEFFDVRSADSALKALNRTDIAGKRIKLEHSRPGGARRNMMLQMNPEYEQDDSRSYQNLTDSPLANSPAGNFWGNSPIDHSPLQSLSKSPLSPTLSSFLHSQRANQTKESWLSNEQGRRVNHIPSYKASTFQKTLPYGTTASSYGSLNSNPGHVDSLSGSEFLWGSPSSSVWHMNPFSSNGKAHMFPYPAQKGHHHVGSAPSGFLPRSSETSSMGSAAFGGASGNVAPRSIRETGSLSFKKVSAPRHSQLFMGNGSSYQWPLATTASIDGSNMNQVDSKKQFRLDLSKIMSGEDLRTTLMIKNIPNKYTRKMLLAAIDETNRGTYDFLYLPIDFKNKCNVGYAFINMVSPTFITALYEAFDGKKWDKFNSEKVASLAYARIQGKTALMTHFQNSSLMNEDRRCHPIVFDGSESSYPFIMEMEHSQDQNTHRS